MSTTFQTGQTLSRGDLDIFLTNASGTPENAYSISFAIYYVDPTTGNEVLIGSGFRTPVNPAVGEYFAALQIPTTATAGDYRIRWSFREYAGSAQQQVVQEFSVVAVTCSTTPANYNTCVADLISKLRFMARDKFPDKSYKFRPPQGEGVVGCYNQVNGFIWEDAELYEFLEIALWKWNMHPPETESLSTVSSLCTNKPVWRAAILWGALVNMAQALAYQWVSEEFSVAPETKVRVFLPDGQAVVLSIEELYTICKES